MMPNETKSWSKPRASSKIWNVGGNDFKEVGDLKQELQKMFWQQHKMGEHQTMMGSNSKWHGWGEDVYLINSTVGPNVSGKGCHVTVVQLKKIVWQTHAHISNANLDNAMIGNHVYFDGDFTSISIGDYSVLE
jgi:hypothetical protein